jgi:glycosyltransferase involved in cell wall biosynthesis
MLAEELIRRGHDITWWTSTFDHFSKRYVAARGEVRTVGPGLELRFLHGHAYYTNLSWQRLINHIEIAQDFDQVARTLAPPDAVFCTFPPIELAYAATRFCESREVASIIDVNDLWPDEMINRSPKALRALVAGLMTPFRYRTARALKHATSIIGISRTFLEWAKHHGCRSPTAPDRVFELGYAPHVMCESDDAANHVLLDERRIDGKFIVFFVGTFASNIDVRTVVEAARILKGCEDIVFVLAGSGETRKDAEFQARGLANVIFPGWLTPAQIQQVGRMAQLGLAAYRPGALMALPNKVFEYLALGLPILNSLPGETKELIEFEKVGDSYTAGDAKSLAAKIWEIARNPAMREVLSQNARSTFARRYSSSVIYPQLANHVEMMARL